MEKVKKHLYPVILMDIDLPHLNGVEATKQIRQLHRDCFVIALTGYNQEELTTRFGTAHFDGYLHKPLTPDSLAPLLASLFATPLAPTGA